MNDAPCLDPATTEPTTLDVSPDDALMLAMFARAATRPEVADRLGCSTATVDRRVARLKSDLAVDTLIEVIVFAVRRRLI